MIVHHGLKGGVGSVGAFDPATLSPYTWHDYTDASTKTESGGYITQIDDKGSAGADLTAVITEQPQDATRNSYDCGDFDGVNDRLDDTTLTASGFKEMWGVFAIDSTTNHKQILHLGDHADTTKVSIAIRKANGSDSEEKKMHINIKVSGTNNFLYSGVLAINTLYLFRLLIDGANTELFIDGSTVDTNASAPSTGSSTTARISHGYREGLSSYALEGPIYEQMTFKAIQGAGAISNLTNYFKTKFAIS